MTSKITPVILSGGSGTRLWPMSRAHYPKQLLALAGDRSLLQETALRVGDPDRFHPPIVIANEEHRFIVGEQLRDIGITPQAIILEPVGRNTAPAAAVAALYLAEREASAVMALLPSDHVVAEGAEFDSAMERAGRAARAGALATFGITPTRADTGYGYIKCGQELADRAGVFRVARFVEKPDRDTAEGYLQAGDHLWNSGMFVLEVGTYLSELRRLRPEILAACQKALAGGGGDLDFLRLDEPAFAACPADSIDYAVMEHTDKAVVVPGDFGWSDVGGWTALWDLADKDDAGNARIGEVLTLDAEGCYLRSDDGQMIAALGVRDLILVSTADAVMVAPRDRAGDVKHLVERLLAEGRKEALHHRRVYRPWGNYDDIDEATRFRVKRIVVKPGGVLSLQRHKHRSEHWVIVRGTAKVTRGEEETLLAENQSTYIPKGVVHRLENPGDEPLHMIEVQVGDYVGEDDIVRLEDTYGRKVG